jgi:hypothetical protein
MVFNDYKVTNFSSDGIMTFIYNNDKSKSVKLNVLKDFSDYRKVSDKHYIDTVDNKMVLIDTSCMSPSLRPKFTSLISDPQNGHILRPATQMDFDRWDYRTNKMPNGELTDNGKIFSHLLDTYQSTYMI